MTDKELRRLSRAELLEMLIDQMEQTNKLSAALEAAQQELADRRIAVESAGTMAEAALALNKVFQAADAAAKQYLQNLQARASGQDEALRRARAETEADCQKMRVEAQRYSKRLRTEADAYWRAVMDKARRLEDGSL